MPKHLTATEAAHPLRKVWAKKNQELKLFKKEIQAATGWSERVFYYKLTKSQKDKLILTEVEIHFISNNKCTKRRNFNLPTKPIIFIPCQKRKLYPNC